jgi:cell wall-associated NlpC family hydrolase
VRARALPTVLSVLVASAVFAPPVLADSAPNGGVAYGSSDSADPAASTRSTTTTTTTTQTAGVDPALVGAASPAPKAAVPGTTAVLGADGLAAPPVGAPPQVQAAILAANQIIGKPYRYGGGHRAFTDSGYDCSGTVSFALHGGGLLDDPLDSRSFFRWGEKGPGAWITVYTKSSHAFMVIAGLRLDTSAAGDPSGLRGPRWRPVLRSTRGYRARHFEGL